MRDVSAGTSGLRSRNLIIPLLKRAVGFSHAASQFITPPYVGDLGLIIIRTACGCCNSRCGMATRVAETPVFMCVVFLILFDTTCSNGRFLHVLWGCVSEPRLKSPYTRQA